MLHQLSSLWFYGKKVLKTNKKCETKFLGEKKLFALWTTADFLFYVCVCVSSQLKEANKEIGSSLQHRAAIASKTLLPESIEKKTALTQNAPSQDFSLKGFFFRRRLFDKIENYFFVKFHWCGRVCQSFCPFRYTREISVLFLTQKRYFNKMPLSVYRKKNLPK